jgi:hypothetical protein
MMLNKAQSIMPRTVLHLPFLLFFLTTFFLNPISTQAIINFDGISGFEDFSQSVQNGEADVLRGVYVENVLKLPVIQQPVDRPYYVSSLNGEATQFRMASLYGNIGLLAHNTLSGRYFSKLKVGQEVRLIYGDGSVQYFVIEKIWHFQALEPESVSSSFRNLDRYETLSAGEMFNRVYVGEWRLVFQTCIEAEGNMSWGRLFVVAMPKE